MPVYHSGDRDIGYNELSGTLPDTMGNLTDLLKMSVFVNTLSGSVPASFGKLSRLTSMYAARVGTALTPQTPGRESV